MHPKSKISKNLKMPSWVKVRSYYLKKEILSSSIIGAVIAIWLVAYHSLDSTLKEVAFRNFLTNVHHKNLEKQLEFLELLKIIPEADSENEDTDNEDEENNLPSGLSMADTAKVHPSQSHNNSIIAYEALLRTTVNMQQTDRGTSFGSHSFDNSVSFPKSLFKLYPLEQLIIEFKEYITCSKENRGHKEHESQERQILKEIVKLIKQERKKIVTTSSVDHGKNSCSPKFYKKLQTKMHREKLEQQVNAYQRPRQQFSPSLEREQNDKVNVSQTKIKKVKRGVSHDFKKKPPKNIEKLYLGSMGRVFVDPDAELKKTLRTVDYRISNVTSRGTVPIPGSNTLSPALNSKGFLANASKTPSLTQFGDQTPNVENTKSILQTRKANRPHLPSINPTRLSEKKLASPSNNYGYDLKNTKTLGSLAEEGTVPTEESTNAPKQVKFVYPSARESEMRESMYGKKRNDVEPLKLMNNRGNFAKRPSPKRKLF